MSPVTNTLAGAAIAGAVIGGVAALATRVRAPRRPTASLRREPVITQSPPISPNGTWAVPEMPYTIVHLAAPIEALAHWPGLGVFLAAVAWSETRGNPSLTSSAGAMGLFQIKPKSARVADLGLPTSVLFQPPYAVALGAWYAYRLRPYAAAGQVIDFLALRRGWYMPSYVRDTAETKERSPIIRTNLAAGLSRLGVDPSFMYTPAFPPGFTWPGIHAVLAAVKAQGALIT